MTKRQGDALHVTEEISIEDVAMLDLLGPGDALLKKIESAFPEVVLLVRSNLIQLSGPKDAVKVAQQFLMKLAAQAVEAEGKNPSKAAVTSSPSVLPELLSQSILSSRGKSIRPKTLGQKAYVDAIDEHTVVFGIGPAGTGKTYLAMAKAVQALQRKEVSRIILTRPAVEAGERLGFLPGTLTDKIDPYLRPLFDALQEMLDPDSIPKLLATATIEVAPLAYMRGRTLNDCFVILDEAQNTTPEQMKMFLTRLGFNSHMVITGDVTQVDLPGGNSGLRSAMKILKDVEGLHFAVLSSADVVRHPLVARIVDAYGKAEAK